MLCPETLCLWIMNLQYVLNSCLLARCFFSSKVFWSHPVLEVLKPAWFNWFTCFSWWWPPTNRWFLNLQQVAAIGQVTESREVCSILATPPLFIFNSEVVYFFMIATSVCSQCQLALSATLCSIIPVLTPKSPWHHSAGCCSNFTENRHKETGAYMPPNHLPHKPGST